MNAERRKVLLRAALLLLAAAALLIGGMKAIDRFQGDAYRETRGEGTEAFMQSGVVEWAGARYRKTPAVKVYLIAGIDRDGSAPGGVSTSRYRNGGQADFLLLLAVDATHRQIHQLQIERDTMTDVTVLSVYGQESGTRVMQICLAHSYGANQEDNAQYTLRAVRKLMDGIEIDGYYMVNYGAVSVLNDELGGVSVTVPDDMTSVNPLWTEGSTVTLAGKEAETFVRTRQTVGQGTNRERMGRQKEFMERALEKLRQGMKKDASFGLRVLAALRKDAATDLTDQQLAEEIRRSAGYQALPVEYLEGEYGADEEGYVEFYPRENSAREWIFRHLYTKE